MQVDILSAKFWPNGVNSKVKPTLQVKSRFTHKKPVTTMAINHKHNVDKCITNYSSKPQMSYSYQPQT